MNGERDPRETRRAQPGDDLEPRRYDPNPDDLEECDVCDEPSRRVRQPDPSPDDFPEG